MSKEVEKIVGSNKDALQPILKDMFRIVKKALILVENCSIKKWREAALMHITSREAFRELLMELEYCFHMICNISSKYNLQLEANILEIQRLVKFHPSNKKAIEEDQDAFCFILNSIKDSLLCEKEHDYKLIDYVISWRSRIHAMECGEVECVQFIDAFPQPIIVRSLGEGVEETNWLGIQSVTKSWEVYDDNTIPLWEKEANILSQLNHPNIIKLYYCGYTLDYYNKKKFEIGMEKGEKSLSQLLIEKRNKTIPFQAKVDMMIQMASGMCYLHDMKVAHRDLKPANVVVTKMHEEVFDEDSYVCIKLIDFGISKMEVKDNVLQVPTGGFPFGTKGYWAPEAQRPSKYENVSIKLDPFKTDVFSFGLICCDILTQSTLDYSGLNTLEIIEERKLNLRQETDLHEMISLIEDCLSLEPSKRPSFSKIYKKLLEIKEKAFEVQFQNSVQRITNSKPTLLNFSIWKDNFFKYFAMLLQRILCLLIHFANALKAWSNIVGNLNGVKLNDNKEKVKYFQYK